MTTHPDLPYEQAKNTEYLKRLDEKLEKNPAVSVIPNPIWIDHAEHQIKAAGFHHPLLGRVGCETDDEEVRDFYIGPWHMEYGSVRVYSFAARIAKLFYQPDADGAEDVVVRRTFTHALDNVSDVDEEWEREGVASPFDAQEIQVPAAPAAGPRRRRATAPPLSAPRLEAQGEQEVEAAPGIDAPPPPPPPSASSQRVPHKRPSRRVDISEGMRAKEAVVKRLEAPREDRLASVLALLQPDQHALVSWPPDESLVVQGHPGTGKTVVAAYRAAFLVNPALYDTGAPLADRATRPLKVLVVGPTAAYVSHVDGLIRPLASSDQVRVTHLAELMDETTGLKKQWPGPIGGEHDDVDGKARFFAERAARLHKMHHGLREGNGARRENIKAIYDLIASNGTPDNPLVEDDDQISWMRKLPPFKQAFQRRYLALMAQCRLAYSPIPDASRYDHIIVDEVQDVSPIEWNVLDQHLKRDGHWTLVGDMNQRRSDVTYSSWQEIADHLALAAEGDFELEVMTRGYRSTGGILRFADKLLPAAERGNQTVQEDGPPVDVQRATRLDALWPKALDVAARLTAKHSDGSTAIITVNPGEMIGELGRRGWHRKGADMTTWTRGADILRLFVPEGARGLEFDAVVVVEPGAFPENLGRIGQLYTSLTRANRELAVVWHKDLPDPLRRAARS